MRTARCHCGDLTLTCDGEPKFVAMCHCDSCQRRTGTSFGLGAWFDRDAIAARGREATFVRSGSDTGAEIHFHFCPNCGTTVYWESPGGGLPEMCGVAVGCFADPSFPQPSLSVHGRSRHSGSLCPAAFRRSPVPRRAIVSSEVGSPLDRGLQMTTEAGRSTV